MNTKIVLAIVTIAFALSIITAPTIGIVYATKYKIDQENDCHHAKCVNVGSIIYGKHKHYERLE